MSQNDLVLSHSAMKGSTWRNLNSNWSNAHGESKGEEGRKDEGERRSGLNGRDGDGGDGRDGDDDLGTMNRNKSAAGRSERSTITNQVTIDAMFIFFIISIQY